MGQIIKEDSGVCRNMFVLSIDCSWIGLSIKLNRVDHNRDRISFVQLKSCSVLVPARQSMVIGFNLNIFIFKFNNQTISMARTIVVSMGRMCGCVNNDNLNLIEMTWAYCFILITRLGYNVFHNL